MSSLNLAREVADLVDGAHGDGLPCRLAPLARHLRDACGHEADICARVTPDHVRDGGSDADEQSRERDERGDRTRGRPPGSRGR